ncbi:hypothetical protein GA0115242_117330 [Streptomyces sp. SolWspMP-5a-2]|nr:hypothetical protein GA0115242_117330 [Streptomyces sp. SolWspMP-5a-2]
MFRRRDRQRDDRELAREARTPDPYVWRLPVPGATRGFHRPTLRAQSARLRRARSMICRASSP